MHTRRFLAAAALLFAAGIPIEAPPAQAPARPRSPKPRAFKMPRFSYGRHLPHQGKRECARRRGGQEWLNFRAADRIRRGLPVSWPYQTM